MRDGLTATAMAMGCFAQACRAMQEMREAAPVREQLDRSIRRLEAMRRDLESRSRAQGQDALFVGLLVGEAGLQSLAGAMATMRGAYQDLHPRPMPKPGWFIEVDGDGESADITS